MDADNAPFCDCECAWNPDVDGCADCDAHRDQDAHCPHCELNPECIHAVLADAYTPT